jgi:hypothetical protein
MKRTFHFTSKEVNRILTEYLVDKGELKTTKDVLTTARIKGDRDKGFALDFVVEEVE